MDEKEIKEHLIATDDDFRRLAEQHQEFERELEVLSQKLYPNEQDQFQETILKKRKLALKDRMLLRMSQFREQDAPVH